MKDIVKTSRLAGQLEKLFRLLNADFFNNELSGLSFASGFHYHTMS